MVITNQYYKIKLFCSSDLCKIEQTPQKADFEKETGITGKFIRMNPWDQHIWRLKLVGVSTEQSYNTVTIKVSADLRKSSGASMALPARITQP